MVQLRNKKETDPTKPVEKKPKKTKSKTIRQILEEKENQLSEKLIDLKISEAESSVVILDGNQDSGISETQPLPECTELNETSKRSEQSIVNEEYCMNNSQVIKDYNEVSHHSETSLFDQSSLRLDELTFLLKSMMNKNALSTFSGKHDEDLDDWIFAMERHFQKTNVPLDQQTDLAVDYLRGNARALYRNIKDPDGLTWLDLKGILVNNFVPKNIQNILRTQLRELKQTGCLEDYIYSFDTIMNKVKDMSEFDKVLYFTDGLRRELKEKVSQRSPKDLFEAKNQALKEEIILGRGAYKTDEKRARNASKRQNYNNHKTKCYYSKEFKRNSFANQPANSQNGYNLRKGKVSIESQTDQVFVSNKKL